MVDRHRSHLRRTLALHHEGRGVEARQSMDAASASSAALFDSLDRFYESSARETAETLRMMEEHASRNRVLQGAAAIVLFFATLAIAVLVLRLVSRQRRSLDVYVARVESANRDLESFAGRVAHDLKNVLSPLQLAAPMLTKSAGKTEAVTSMAARIQRVTRKATQLVDGLLAFARGAAPPEGTERSSVSEEVGAVLEELEPVAEEIHAKIETKIEPSLAVACSPSLLHVVLLNVVSNAIKFLQDRDQREVRVGARAEGKWCIVDVEDTGPGIPRAAIDKVFEPFFRVEGVRAPGSGIGLATVRRIVDAHQGDISLTSVEGEGTRVSIRLPLASAAD
jgi:signal transduction histidine kinase